jgi:acetyl-CoA C-acetyltransferase
MAPDPRSPVIVGVGQHLHRADGLDDALSPVDLIVEAVRAAAADTGAANVLSHAQSLRVVQLLSWRYRDPAALIAARLGIHPAETAYTTAGGNTPQSLVNLTASEILDGSIDCAVLMGGEAWRTRMRARRTDAVLAWDKQADDVEPTRLIGSEMKMNHPYELERGVVMPVQVYPMFETALRAHRGEAVADHQVRTSELWARFSDVAAANPYAWVRDAKSAEEIRTPSPSNRMIGTPYPKLMNSNNDVDMSAAVIMTSVEKARELGISEDRWVFIHAGADAHDHDFVSNRADLHSSPAIRTAGRAAMQLSDKDADDFAFVDLYSCFPSAVQIGAQELGFGLDRDLTVTGGLCFAGGPWNNYVMHAIATMVQRLRDEPGGFGFVSANGGYVTKHAFGVYSTTPPANGFQTAHPQEEVDALPRRELADDWQGDAVIEGYTVMHDREGVPETAFAACLLADGRRTWGVGRDRGVAALLAEGEWVGQKVRIGAEAELTPS